MNLREIAKVAGVSLTTVSLVLNGKPGIGRETRERVQKLLYENGYLSNPEEEMVQTICFLKYIRHAHLVKGNPGFVTQIMDAVEQECRKNGYNLQVVTTSDTDDAMVRQSLNKPTVKGVILLGTELPELSIDVFKAVKKPLLVVDNALPNLPVSSVTMDNRQAIFSAVEHFVQLGYRKIGFLYNSIPSRNDTERRYAFEEAMLHMGLTFDPAYVYPIFPTMEGAAQSVQALLDAGTEFPSALVANNDSIAIGAMRAFKSNSIRVPEDISIIGFDGLPFSALADPPLTTVDVPCESIGSWATHILLDIMKGRCPTACKMLVGTRLEVRSSTCPHQDQSGRMPGMSHIMPMMPVE